jgi:L-alanine-DL-glutamate epimerase-like enolase superfamily enzyme
MKIEKIETTVLEMPYTKPLVTATNNFTVARGLLVKVVSNGGTEGYGCRSVSTHGRDVGRIKGTG